MNTTSKSQKKRLDVQQAVPKLRFMHLRSAIGKGTVTIGYRIDDATKTAFFIKAKCNPKDNFCRRVGRDICIGRFNKYGPLGEFKFKNYDEVKEYFIAQHHPDAMPWLKDANAAKAKGAFLTRVQRREDGEEDAKEA
jgi:hypothetical protein